MSSGVVRSSAAATDTVTTGVTITDSGLQNVTTNLVSSPRGGRKLATTFKGNTKRTGGILQHSTPPDSPTMPLRRFK